MKILGTIFRLLCALVVLLAIAVYLDGSLQVTLLDYAAAFTPEHIQALAGVDGWLIIAAGALLLLTLCCGLTLGWNIAYSIITLTFFAEAAVMVLGPELALPAAARGLGWEQLLRELALNYPVPALMIPAICILGCLCSTAPVRIAATSLICCALSYGCAELLHYGAQYWQSMPEPPLPGALEIVNDFPWILAALPAAFFVQYGIFMAMFETFVPRRKKSHEEKKEAKEEKADDKKEDKRAEAKLPAAAATVTAAPVVVKRPIIHKKNPISPAPSAARKEEPKPEEQKPEATPDTREEAEAPAQETKSETPAAESQKEEAAKPATDTPGEKEEPKAEEAPKEENTDTPSAPEPPKNEVS